LPRLSGVLYGSQGARPVPRQTPPERPEPANLPIADEVHTGLALLADHLGCHGSYPLAECLPVVRLAAVDCPHRLHNIRRTGEPAGVGREDTVCAPLHGLPPNTWLSVRCLYDEGYSRYSRATRYTQREMRGL